MSNGTAVITVSDEPVSRDDFSQLMAAFGPPLSPPHMAVAVSGGPDSMALMLLMADWAKGLGGHAIALTVDHGLRPESKLEAEQVGQWLANHAIEHHVLTWSGPKPTSKIQAEARTARYDLMAQWCQDHHLFQLAVAHTLEDQAETFLLRLRQGSGLDGLAAMSAKRQTGPVEIIRPLLSVSKQRLLATLRQRDQPFILDPSNDNRRFERVRMRQMMRSLGLSAESISAVSSVLATAKQTMALLVDRAEDLLVSHHAMGFCLLDGQGIADVPREVGLRLLSRLLLRIGGQSYPPRSESLERLLDRQKGTLAGCRLMRHQDGVLLLCREARRLEPPKALPVGHWVPWDSRFMIKVMTPNLMVGALGEPGWRQIMEQGLHGPKPHLPAVIRSTLPALWHQGSLCAVPHMGYKTQEGSCIIGDSPYFCLDAMGYIQSQHPSG